MDKWEGLEQESKGERARRRKHIDWGHIRKFWWRLWKKENKKKGKLKLPSLKDKLKIKKGEHLSRLWKAQEISINTKKKKRLSYKRWLLVSIIKPTMLSGD